MFKYLIWVGGTFGERLVGVSLLKEVHHWVQLCGFKRPILFPFSSIYLMFMNQMGSSQLLRQYNACLPSAMLPVINGHGLSASETVLLKIMLTCISCLGPGVFSQHLK